MNGCKRLARKNVIIRTNRLIYCAKRGEVTGDIFGGRKELGLLMLPVGATFASNQKLNHARKIANVLFARMKKQARWLQRDGRIYAGQFGIQNSAQKPGFVNRKAMKYDFVTEQSELNVYRYKRKLTISITLFIRSRGHRVNHLGKIHRYIVKQSY